MLTNKVTITDRINAIAFDTLTEEDFAFLVERALKSVRPAGKRSDKPTKAQLAYRAELTDVAAFVAEKGTVTCADVQNAFGVSNQKAARMLKDAPGVVQVTKSKGKVKATWALAQ